MIRQSQNFEGQVALLTGGGTALGRAYARYLGNRGARVLVNDIDPARSDEVAWEVRRIGGAATPFVGSIADVATANDLVTSAASLHGRLDVVINNAEIAEGIEPTELTELTDERVRSVVDMHLLGTIWVTRAALANMNPSGRGRLVNTAPGIGSFGMAQYSSYSAAFAGIIGFTRACALEVAYTGIKVNAVAPIADSGPMMDSFFRRYPQLDRASYSADLVAPTVAYLCHESCQLNGELLSAGAGRVARIFTNTVAGHFDLHADHVEIGVQLSHILSTDYSFLPRSALDEFLLIEV